MIVLTEKTRNLQTNDFRDAVFGSIEKVMKNDSSAVILTNDMGAIGLDRIATFASERVINVGITEQNMMSVASGLALNGRTVFVYGIISHIIFRALEQIKLDICVQNLPVILVGVGSGLAYGVDGPTHHGTEDVSVLRVLPNITIYNPSDCMSAAYSIDAAYQTRTPCFIRMDKEVLPNLYNNAEELDSGMMIHGKVGDGVIISSGIPTWAALHAQEILDTHKVPVRVIDLLRIKPLSLDSLRQHCKGVKWIVVIDEATSGGGIDELISRAFVGQKLEFFHSINLGDEFLLGSSKREWAWKHYGLRGEDIANNILNRIGKIK
jgi:transketolase